MNDNPSITNADDRKLIELIGQAHRRVVYMAPGITSGMATALAEAWARLGQGSVSVILDVDPEVCRLGYGTIEGLTEIQNAATETEALVFHQSGVRVGLLVSDEVTLIYSPIPLLVEAGSETPQHPNAIQIGVLPLELAKDVGLGENPDKERSVGLDPVQPVRIQEVQKSLANNPPAKFDLARKVRVFTSHFQFVELEMTGCYLSRKKVPIPSYLMGLAEQEEEVQRQFHAHFNLVSRTGLQVKAGGRVLTEERLRKQKDKIASDFLVSLKNYGNVVLRANKEQLVKAVKGLRADVEAFQNGVCQTLQTQMDQNADALVSVLLPAVHRSPPPWYTKIHGPVIKDAILQPLLQRDIRYAFGQAADLVQEMKVKLVFKDVAYESLVDQDFLEVARKAMPGVEFLHDEYDAAKAKVPSQLALEI